MRLQQYLTEKFYKGIRYGKTYIEVYKNSSKSELRGIFKNSKYNEVRYIIDKNTGDAYVWPADYIVHSAMWVKIGDKRDIYSNKSLSYGILTLSKDKERIDVRHTSNMFMKHKKYTLDNFNFKDVIKII